MAKRGPIKQFLGFADNADEDTYVTQFIHWVGNRTWILDSS